MGVRGQEPTLATSGGGTAHHRGTEQRPTESAESGLDRANPGRIGGIQAGPVGSCFRSTGWTYPTRKGDRTVSGRVPVPRLEGQ